MREISAQPWLQRAALYLTFGSAVSILFSIAASQILLGLALAALLLSGTKLRLPPIWLPVSLFLALTMLSLAFSPHASLGNPQVRKIFVFATLLTVYSTIRDVATIRLLVLCWAASGALVSARALIQFANKFERARALGANFYDYYVADRITGFMSHWMTFGGQAMLVLLLLLAFLMFSPESRKRGRWFWLLCGFAISVALLLGLTRSIWAASAAGTLYLLWFWKRRLVLAAPVALLVALLLSPSSVRERFASTFSPRKDVDSNQHRIVTWRTGWRMIQAHPWLGLGPEEVKIQFDAYVPPDVPRPLPKGWYGHLHNIYLQYAAERGVLAMLTLVWMLVQILWDFGRAVQALPPGPGDSRFLLRGGIAVVIATMIAGIFEVNLGDSEVLTMFLVVVACGYVAAGQTRSVPIAEAAAA